MSSATRPHTGILREETLILRQVFGYDDQSPPPSLADPLPQTGSPLPGSSIKDTLVFSVDVDTGGGYELISPDQSFHVGISVFDTRYLVSESESESESQSAADSQQAITSYQFINRDTKPCTRAAKHFLLGATELQPLPSIAIRILDLTQDRDYILISHGTNEDVKFLNNLDPEITSRACYILDTVKAAQHTLHLSYRYSLEKLLSELGIPYQQARLHAAGNDAFFTLKGLLMIAARDMSATLGTLAIEAQTSTIATLEAIARAPYPLPAIKSQEAPAREKPPKLSIGAKRRLRTERKALRRSNAKSTSTSELGRDGCDGLGSKSVGDEDAP